MSLIFLQRMFEATRRTRELGGKLQGGKLTTGRNHWLPIAEIAASKVADRKGNAFIVEKIVKKHFLLFSLLFKHFGITKH